MDPGTDDTHSGFWPNPALSYLSLFATLNAAEGEWLNASLPAQSEIPFPSPMPPTPYANTTFEYTKSQTPPAPTSPINPREMRYFLLFYIFKFHSGYRF